MMNLLSKFYTPDPALIPMFLDMQIGQILSDLTEIKRRLLEILYIKLF